MANSLPGFLDTTEIYDTNLGHWAISGAKLPQPMRGLRATNIDGRVLIFGILFIISTSTDITRTYIIAGGYNKAKPDDILEYNPVEDSMVPVQKLQERAWHAISVVKVRDYAQWCQYPQQPSSSARLSSALLTITFCFFKVFSVTCY